MAINRKAFTARIVALRSAQGLSVEDFASKIGLARSNLYKLEAGHFLDPSSTTLGALARGFGITIEELLEERPPRGGRTRRPADSSVPAPLVRFVQEWESQHTARIPKDAVHSLARLQFRGRRPKTVEDWRVIYTLVERLLRGRRRPPRAR